MTFITSRSPTIHLQLGAKKKFLLKKPSAITTNNDVVTNFPGNDAWMSVAYDRSVSMTHSTLGSATMLPATSMRVATVSAASSAIASSRNGPHLFSLLLAFVAGGLFFSTVMAAMTASYAIGMQNSLRVWKMLLYVISKVWSSFSTSCKLAKDALLPPDVYNTDNHNITASLLSSDDPNLPLQDKAVKKRWFWKRAYKVFIERLKLTRLTASEGWEAMKMEADFYSVIVGIPGLLPLQYVLDRLYPFSLTTMLSDAIKDSLKEVKNRQVHSMNLVSFQSGDMPPQLLGARAYNINATSNSTIPALAMDIDVSWIPSKDCKAKIDMVLKGPGKPRIPIHLRNIQYEGVVRLIAAPLTSSIPGYGALLVSLPTLPKLLNVDVTVAGGQITKVPWLRTELIAIMQKSLQENLLWPKRVVIPTMISSQQKQLLTDIELQELELSDPLLLAEHEIGQRQKEKDFLFEKENALVANTTELTVNISVLEDSTITSATDHEKNETRKTPLYLWGRLMRSLPGKAKQIPSNETTYTVQH